jgi:hypothetical protein
MVQPCSDTGRKFLTSTDKVNLTAALTGDHTLGLCYYMGTSGTGFSIPIDMSTMAGSTTARWYDVNNGTYTAINGSPFANSGVHTFTTPGNNSNGNPDWLLVLESGSVPITALAPAYKPDLTTSGYTVTVFDCNGRIINHNCTNRPNSTLSKPGVYFVQRRNNIAVKTHKVVVRPF